MKLVVDYLKSLLKKGDTIILGCSGGPDSMCLLSLLMKENINVIVAHVNHHVRKESDEEYSYLKSFCEKNNITFEGLDLYDLPKDNFESIARKKRYEFFESLYNKYHAKYIMTAHHGDDEVETILMRLTRGSNLPGYIGIKKNDGKYVRPLLNVTKEDIINYCRDNNIKYFVDKTNNEDSHTRNRYRKEVLPFLKKENKNVHLKYLSFSEELSKYDEFINKYINKISDLKDNGYINIDVFLKQDRFIQERIIINMIKELQKDYELPVNNEILNNIMELVSSNNANSEIDLYGNFIAQKSYNKFSIKLKSNSNSFNEVFDNSFENELFIINKVDSTLSDSNNVIRLDSKEIKLPLIIRSKEPSDVIDAKNLGHKKVSDIFVDNKVSKDDRNKWPIVVDSNNTILWIPGIKKSKFAKDKDKNYDIILVSERKDINEKCKKE